MKYLDIPGNIFNISRSNVREEKLPIFGNQNNVSFGGNGDL